MRAEVRFHAVLVGIAMAMLVAGCRTDPNRPPPPPKPSGTFELADKLPVRYESKGKGEPTLVFIHCWGCDRTFWRNQIDEFSRNNRVVWFDLPGHGESGRSRTEWTLDGLGNDVADLVEGLQLTDVVLIGHSMGGPVALMAARRLTGRVRGVVCVDTLHNADVRQSKEMLDPIAVSFEKDFSGTLKQMLQAIIPPSTDPKIVEDIAKSANAADRTAILALMRDFANYDPKGTLAAAGVPIRCINAAARPPSHPETNVRGNREFADFDAILMEDVGHYPMLERPQEFNENLRFVLREFSGPR